MFYRNIGVGRLAAALLITNFISAAATQRTSATPFDLAPLSGHSIDYSSIASRLGQVDPVTPVNIDVVLKPRNAADLDTLLKDLYDPSSPSFHHFLSSADFTTQFGPAQSEYDAVVDYLTAQGLSITRTHANRLVVDAVGRADEVERAFNVQLDSYSFSSGRMFHAPASDPMVPESIANVVSTVVGLDTSVILQPQVKALSPEAQSPHAGSGPYGGLAPRDISAAYNLSGSALSGGGQTIALFELDGYNASDIAAYAKQYGIRGIPLRNEYVDNYGGSAGANALEVTLDIEMIDAIAPGASQVVVYEAPNSLTSLIDEYNQIATDNTAKQVSTSWGMPELWAGSTLVDAENVIFKQMAAQGQSMYAAAGDHGAYDDGVTLSVDDPGSQPYVCCVGGTRLSMNTNGSWAGETTWNDGSDSAGGGGVSQVWSKPFYQAAVGGSSTMRNVPDVSLNADPATGYSIYYGGQWGVVGGTSAAAPLWAGLTALVNQRLTSFGGTALGFANPVLYRIAAGPNYASDFHDVDDESTNLYYAAGKGYDNATGWGSFNGQHLIGDMMGSQGVVPFAPGELTAKATSSSTIDLTWSASAGAGHYQISRSAVRTGSCVPIATSTATSFQDTGLASGMTYYYEVASVGTAGTSTNSNEVSVTTAIGPPPAPQSLSADATSSRQIKLTWKSVSAATAYNVLRSRTPGGSYASVGSSSGTSFSDNGLKPNTPYYYVVIATNALYFSSKSNQASATTGR